MYCTVTDRLAPRPLAVSFAGEQRHDVHIRFWCEESVRPTSRSGDDDARSLG